MSLTPPGRILGLRPGGAEVAVRPAAAATETWWRLSYEVRRPMVPDVSASTAAVTYSWERIYRITLDEQGARAQLAGIRRLQERGDDSVRITRADDSNLARLRLGFPAEVDGFLAWNRGDLAKRLRDAGVIE